MEEVSQRNLRHKATDGELATLCDQTEDRSSFGQAHVRYGQAVFLIDPRIVED